MQHYYLVQEVQQYELFEGSELKTGLRYIHTAHAQNGPSTCVVLSRLLHKLDLKVIEISNCLCCLPVHWSDCAPSGAGLSVGIADGMFRQDVGYFKICIKCSVPV